MKLKFKNLAGAVYSDDLLAGVSERSVREVRRSRKSRDVYRTRLALQRMRKFERALRRKVPTRQELLSRRCRRRHELDDEDGDGEDDDVSVENAAGKRGPSSSRRAAFGVGEILDLADIEDVLADPELQGPHLLKLSHGTPNGNASANLLLPMTKILQLKLNDFVIIII